MADIRDIVQQVRERADAEARERLRRILAAKPVDWLVEELVALLMGTPVPAVPTPRNEEDARQAEQQRALRLDRIRAWQLDTPRLAGLVQRYRELTREWLEAQGHLGDAPPRGAEVIEARHRSPEASAILEEAKDLLYALLFGDEETGVRLRRVERERLTLTLPHAKAHTLAFLMKAATEIGAEGTRRDPHRVADDDRAPNVLIQVEYGEVAEELVGNGIAACLRLINALEVNERVLYARMENVEESTLD